MPSKLKEREFYCVACRKTVTSHPEDICVKMYGTRAALKGRCTKCDTNLTKFISTSSKPKYVQKYGKC